MTPSKPDWISLKSEQLSVEIDPQGAQLSVLRDSAGRDLLWNGDAAFWNGRAPILFPIVGAVAAGSYRLGQARYALPRHGFARGSRFELVDSSARQALFRLQASPATRAVYPFAFELDVAFELRGATLEVTTSVRNHDDHIMPASVGYHPAFRWPLPYGQPREAHYLEFAVDEPSPIRRLDAQGLMTDERHRTPVEGRRLRLDDRLFEDDVVIFDQLHAHSLTYGAEQGPRIEVAYPQATYLGIWTKPGGAPFICIEPWRGVADPEGYSGDFADKPGIFKVAPGAVESLRMDITLQER